MKDSKLTYSRTFSLMNMMDFGHTYGWDIPDTTNK
jgi:hypothetical protein